MTAGVVVPLALRSVVPTVSFSLVPSNRVETVTLTLAMLLASARVAVLALESKMPAAAAVVPVRVVGLKLVVTPLRVSTGPMASKPMVATAAALALPAKSVATQLSVRLAEGAVV